MPPPKSKGKTKKSPPKGKKPPATAPSSGQRGVLEIEFSGLFALVLNDKNPAKATEARILLLSGEKVLGYTKSQVEREGRGWAARLCVPTLNVADATAADETLETFGGDQLAVWRLEGPSTLTITNDSGDPLVVSTGKRKRQGAYWKNRMPSPMEPPEDISWLPEMERIASGAGKLKSGLWDGWGGAGGPLVGKVILTSGRIEAIQTSARVYMFQDAARNITPNYRQCFANGVRVRVWLSERKAKLLLTNPDRVIELRENPDYTPIRASLTNHSGTSDSDHTATSDPHFKAFYALSQTGHTLQQDKRKIPVESGGTVIHSKVRPCMGVGFWD